jgi:N-methylhydantoinase B
VADQGYDVVTAEIVRNGLSMAALEMNRTLVRTAFNSLLYEALDFGVGIVSRDGELWADAPGVAGFVVSLPAGIRTGLEQRGVEWFCEGDIVIHNDPYTSGTHISDTCIYMPIFCEGGLVGFSASMAHWADIGGKTPGGWCPDSTDVYQEGLCFIHQKLVAAGERNEALWEFIGHNVRVPETVFGDLEAQIAACLKGVERVLALCSKYGLSTVVHSMVHVLDRTETAVRRAIQEIPDGRYSASTQLDHDGVDLQSRPRVCLTLTVAHDTITASFAGSSPATAGPVNEPEIGARGDVCSAIKGLLMPLDPTNGGHFRPIEFESIPNLIVSPQRPAPCDSYGYVGVALCVLAFRALAQAVPERCPAGGYQLFGPSLFRIDPRHGEPFIYMGPISGGDGARPFADGPSLVCAGNGDTPNTPIEILETRFPIRCEQLSLRPDAAGDGEFRGGYGLTQDLRLLGHGITMQLAQENYHEPLARGLAGGLDGAPSYVIVNPGGVDERVLSDRIEDTGTLVSNDLIRVQVGGGGGIGNPYRRDPTRVLREVRDGLLTVDDAHSRYGVVLRADDAGDLAIDEPATAAARVG